MLWTAMNCVSRRPIPSATATAATLPR
jgi:hypothetical protein